MKGAPECILSRCVTVAFNNKSISMTDEMKQEAYKATESLADTGIR